MYLVIKADSKKSIKDKDQKITHVKWFKNFQSAIKCAQKMNEMISSETLSAVLAEPLCFEYLVYDKANNKVTRPEQIA